MQVVLVQYFVEGEDGGDVIPGGKFCLIDKKRFRENWKAEHEALEKLIADHIGAKSVAIHNFIWMSQSPFGCCVDKNNIDRQTPLG